MIEGLKISDNALKALLDGRDDPEWIIRDRERAWKAFGDIPMPTTKDELWKYTDVGGSLIPDLNPSAEMFYQPVDKISDFPVGALSQISEEAIHLEQEGGWCKPGLIIQHDSRVTYTDVDADIAKKGVVFCSMEEAVGSHSDLVREHIGKVVDPRGGKFKALSSAFWSGGVFLYVPEGIEIKVPFKSYFMLSGGGRSVFQHSLIVLEPGAKVTYIEQFRSEDFEAGSVCSGVVEAVVKKSASLNYTAIQNWGANVVDISTRKAVVSRDANVDWVSGTLGGRLAKSFYTTRLAEQGADTSTKGFHVSAGRQHHDFYAEMLHEAPNTTGNMLYKGVLKDNSRSVFRGLINIAPEAQHTDSYLANRNLLLSEDARVDTVPTLEINANDVKASHGATVGQINRDEVFYLMSRGLTRAAAEKMIVHGFFDPVVDAVDSNVLRSHLYDFIDRKLNA